MPEQNTGIRWATGHKPFPGVQPLKWRVTQEGSRSFVAVGRLAVVATTPPGPNHRNRVVSTSPNLCLIPNIPAVVKEAKA